MSIRKIIPAVLLSFSIMPAAADSQPQAAVREPRTEQGGQITGRITTQTDQQTAMQHTIERTGKAGTVQTEQIDQTEVETDTVHTAGQDTEYAPADLHLDAAQIVIPSLDEQTESDTTAVFPDETDLSDPNKPGTEASTETEISEEELLSLHIKKDLDCLRFCYGNDIHFLSALPWTDTDFPPFPSFRLYTEVPGYPIPQLPEDMHTLEYRLARLTASYEGTWSVYVKNLTTGETLTFNDTAMKSASIMKLFIMGTVYEMIDEGNLTRTSEISDLLLNMISYSSNNAANQLLTILGQTETASSLSASDNACRRGIALVNSYIRRHGYSSMTHEYNGFEDTSFVFHPTHNNRISAKDVGLLLERVYHRTFGSRSICNEVEDMMLKQTTRYKIPKGLPDGIQAGNKTGEMDFTENDAAVIYGEQCDYILVVLSTGWTDKETALNQIQDISSLVYRFLQQS